MEYFEQDVSDQTKAEIELNLFEYSNSKRYLAKPDIIEYVKNNKPQYDLILGVKTMKKYGIMLDFKDKVITIDEVKLPIQNINYLQGSSTLRALKLNHSLAMELNLFKSVDGIVCPTATLLTTNPT